MITFEFDYTYLYNIVYMTLTVFIIILLNHTNYKRGLLNMYIKLQTIFLIQKTRIREKFI